MQKMQEMEQLANVQGLPTDRNTLNKLMAMHSGLNNKINNNPNMGNRGALTGSAQAALALSNYQNILMRQNSMNSNSGSLQREGSSSFNNSIPSPSSTMQGSAGASALISGSLQGLPASGFSSPHLQQQQQQQLQQLQQRSLSANSILQQGHSQGSQANQALQQQMIQQLLQEMSHSNGGMQPQSLGGSNGNGNMAKNGGVGFGGQTLRVTGDTSNVSGSNGPVPSRSNSFKAASNSDSSAAGGNNGFNQRTSDMPQNLHLPEDVDIGNDFMDSSFFNSDLDDNMGYSWKA